jgi:hypothetical protein
MAAVAYPDDTAAWSIKLYTMAGLAHPHDDEPKLVELYLNSATIF